MVMAITEGDEPLPPREGGEFTPQFHDFLKRCICKEPAARASATELLEDEWFAVHGIGSMEDAVGAMRAWLEGAGLSDEYAHVRGVTGFRAGEKGAPGAAADGAGGRAAAPVVGAVSGGGGGGGSS